MKKILFIFFSILTLNLALTPATFACLDENGNTVEGTDGLSTAKCAETIEELPAEVTNLISPNPALISGQSSTEDSYFPEGDSASGVLDYSGDVNHSLFLAGSDVTYRGAADGIAFMAGNSVDLLGNIAYGMLAGSNVKISGEVTKDLFAAGQSVTLAEDANIARDVFLAGQTVTISTNLYGNAYIAAARVNLDSVTIEGDAYIEAGEIVVTGKSSISGILYTSADTQIIGKDNLSVTEIADIPGSSLVNISTETTSSNVARQVSSKLFSYLARICLTFILIAVATPFFKRLLASFRPVDLPKNLGLGLLEVIGLPLAALLLLITLVGVPVSLLALCFWGFALYLSTSFSGLILGGKILCFFKNKSAKTAKPVTTQNASLDEKSLQKAMEKLPSSALYASSALGIALIMLLELIPVLGGLVSFVSVFFGFGYLCSGLVSCIKACNK